MFLSSMLACAQQQGAGFDEEVDSDSVGALQEDAPSREKRLESARALPIRRKAKIGVSDPITRSGVSYFEEWTLRAGAKKLRVPAYFGWTGVRTESDFYFSQLPQGEPGEHLALAMVNSEYVKASRSRFVNYYGLIWVPQDSAFLSMTGLAFASFKEEIQQDIVEDRRRRVRRSDFRDFGDYLDFKKGLDERVAEPLPGYLLKAVDEPDLVMYFAVSEFVYEGRREEVRQPMIMTIAYALVRGKLLRFDFRRLYTADEDAVALVAFTQKFISDMRKVNGFSERKLR